MSKLVAPDTVQTSFHVRFAETDAMGIVHHAAYLVWFEESRSAFMRAQGAGYVEFSAEGAALAVSEAYVRHLSPAYYDRLITVSCRVSEVKSRKINFEYTVFEAESGLLLATGYTRHICIDTAGAVTRIPEKWRKLWAESVAAAAGMRSG